MQKRETQSRKRNGWDAQQAISNATLKLLMEEGYAGLSISKVAALAKSSKATIYKRWQTKEHLVLEAFSQMGTLAPNETGTLFGDLMDLHARYISALQDSPLRSVLTRLMSECVDNPSLQSAMESLYEQRRVPLRLVFTRALRRGELPKNVDIEMAVDLIQGAMTVRVYFVQREATDEWFQKLFQTVILGIGGKKVALS